MTTLSIRAVLLSSALLSLQACGGLEQLCTSRYDCGDDSICIDGKCTVVLLVQPDAGDLPSAPDAGPLDAGTGTKPDAGSCPPDKLCDSLCCGADEFCSPQSGICQAKSCTDACVKDAKRCAGNGVETCTVLPSTGCTAWSAPVSCGSGGTCSNGACAEKCDYCEVGKKQCDGKNVLTCKATASGCGKWEPSACGSGQTCAQGACVTPATCGAGETYCGAKNECCSGGQVCDSTGGCSCDVPTQSGCGSNETCLWYCPPFDMVCWGKCVPAGSVPTGGPCYGLSTALFGGTSDCISGDLCDLNGVPSGAAGTCRQICDGNAGDAWATRPCPSGNYCLGNKCM